VTARILASSTACRGLHRLREWWPAGPAALALLLAATLLLATPARAEYGDVVINNFSDAAGMRPVVFPHWFHRVRFRCKVCHADLGFQFKAGGNEINMLKIIDGQFCGSCHNGELAWAVENCNLCHSAKPGTPTQVHESTLQKLAPRPAAASAPVVAAASAPARAAATQTVAKP
jgi:c(7)-type cytochrome triheme protein